MRPARDPGAGEGGAALVNGRADHQDPTPITHNPDTTDTTDTTEGTPMSTYPENLRYTAEHEWVDLSSPARVGITQAAVDELKDIVFVDLPQAGATVTAGEVCGEIESVKSVAELYSPVTGTVAEVNQDVVDAPELINADPYSAWLFSVDVEGGLPEALLDAVEYARTVADAQA